MLGSRKVDADQYKARTVQRLRNTVAKLLAM